MQIWGHMQVPSPKRQGWNCWKSPVRCSRLSAPPAARTCSFVGLEPARVVEMLKDRPSWFRDCRSLDIITALSTGTDGTIELLYMQADTDPRALLLLNCRYLSISADGMNFIDNRSIS